MIGKILGITCSMGFFLISQNILADNQNLVKNGTFADGMKSWLFQTKDYATEVNVINGALKFSRSKAKGFSRLYQDIDIKSGVTYKFSFKAKSTVGAQYNAWIILRSKDGKWLSSTAKHRIYQKKRSDTWIEAQLIIKVPVNVNKIRLNVGIKGVDANSIFDDISLKQISKISSSEK